MQRTSMPGGLQGGRRRGHVQRLMTKLVGGDQQDPHSARIAFASLPLRTARRSRSRAGRGRCAVPARPARASRRGRRGSRGSGRPRAAPAPACRGAIEISSPVTPGTARASACPRTSLSTPRLRDRQHHHPGGGGLAAQVVERQPEGVAQDQLLEAHAHPEAQRARAQPADRAGGELEHPHATRRRSAARRVSAPRPGRARRPPRPSSRVTASRVSAGRRDGVT